MPRIAKPKRLPHGSARDRILAAAEILFAELGPDGVSFRELSAAAKVSLSATHYHFGSKQALLEEVFTRRSQMLIQARRELLEAASGTGGNAPSLEAVLDAFVRPALEVTRGDRNEIFNRLRARLSVEQGEVTRRIVSAAFDESDRMFLDALQQAAPGLSREDICWRFHFLVGALIYTMSDSGQLEGLSEGLCTPSDTQAAIAEMVRGFAALFGATPTTAGVSMKPLAAAFVAKHPKNYRSEPKSGLPRGSIKPSHIG